VKQARIRKWVSWGLAVCLLLGSGEHISAREESSGEQLQVTFSPVDQAVGVPQDSLLSLTFHKRMRLKNKKEITAKSVETFIKVTDSENRRISFSALWDASRNVITLDPQGNLKGGTRYTITLLEKKLIDEKGNPNQQLTSTFMTLTPVDVIAPQATIYPAHGAKEVSLKSKVTLQFAEEVVFPDGSPLSSKTVGNLVRITDDKGTLIPTYCTWNKSKRTLTVKPRGKWQPYTTYRVYLAANQVKDLAGNANQEQSANFITGSR
jgi:hypothetical protein